jgi:Sigma-70 region 2
MHAFDPDREILRLCANGEMNAAAHWLTHRYRKAIYHYCCRELRDAALAEDVCQHIFIVAYRDLGRFERRSTVWTWLFAITRHHVVNAAKARTRWEERTVELAESPTCTIRGHHHPSLSMRGDCFSCFALELPSFPKRHEPRCCCGINRGSRSRNRPWFVTNSPARFRLE